MHSLLSNLTRAVAKTTAQATGRLLIAGAVALPALMAAGGAHAQSAPSFALTCIGTETESTVNFQYRWGNDAEWRNASVRPGKWQMLSYRYAYPGENRAPQLYVRFDDDMSSGVRYKVLRVPTYAASDKNCESQGWTLNFYQRGDLLELLDEEGGSTRL